MTNTLTSADMTKLFTCGNLGFSFSGSIPYAVHMIITIIKIVVPVLLIIFGMIDFMKSVTAAKEDEIKKGQQTFIKRLIAGVLVFFVIQIVQLVIRFVSNSNNDVTKCFNCFVNGEKDADNACKLKS